MDLAEYRASLAAQNGGNDPYADLTDVQFATRLHQKHYADIPFQDFATKVGVAGDFSQRGPTARLRTDPRNNTIDGVPSRTQLAMDSALGAADQDEEVRAPQARLSMLQGTRIDQTNVPRGPSREVMQRLPGNILKSASSQLQESFAGAGRAMEDINTNMAVSAGETYRRAGQKETPDFTSQFNTQLSPQEEQQYQQWRAQQSKSRGHDMALDEADYDLRGAWKSGAEQAANGHLPDTFKKPNHPTFSKESQYSGVSGVEGGEWKKVGDKWQFIASPDSLKFRSPEQLKEYFARAESGNDLILPESAQKEATQRQAAIEGADTQAFQSELRAGGLGRMQRRAAAAGQEAMPPDAGPIERSVQSGLASTLVTAPIVTAGALIPGASVPALLALGGQTASQRYGELRNAGIPEGEAALSSAYLGGLEVLTEKIPLGSLAKKSPFIERAAEFLVTDVLGENISTAAQIADDYRLGLNDNVTIADIKQALADTTGATIVGAGGQLTMSALGEHVMHRANELAQRREPQIEAPILTDVVEPPTLTDVAMEHEEHPSEHVTMEGDGELLPGEIGVDESPPEEVTLETNPMEEFRRNDAELEHDDELAGVSVEQPDEGPPAAVPRITDTKGLSMAERRELFAANKEAVKAALTPKTKPMGITVVAGTGEEEGLHGVAVDGEVRAWYPSQDTARQVVQDARKDQAAERKGTNVVAGTKIERPAEPTPGQAKAGNYRKPQVKIQGLTVRIENIKGSERSGVSEDGRSWTRKMEAPYGYISQTAAKDGDAVDVFVGEHPDSDMVYVIDQLTPDGRRYDEVKTVVGAQNQREARELYLKNYPEGWQGLGAITPMPLAKFKKWVYTPATKKPLAWKAPPEPFDARVPARAAQLKHIATQAGWQEEGGRAITDEDTIKPQVTGRTKWLARDEGWADAQREAPLPHNVAGKATAVAVNKAVEGKKLSAAEGRHVKALLDRIDRDDAELERLAGHLEESPEGMSDKELAALESKLERLAMQMDDRPEQPDLAEIPTNGLRSDVPMFERASGDIKVRPGRGMIKDKFLAEIDGQLVPGGPWDNEEAAHQAAVAHQKELIARSEQDVEKRAWKDRLVSKLRNGVEATPDEIKKLGLGHGSADLRWFIPAAADLFGISSREVRPYIADQIRVGSTDMGAKREFVTPTKALAAIAKAANQKPMFERIGKGQSDLFGDKVDVKNALKKLQEEKDRRRNSGQESTETGKEDDLFSESRKQKPMFARSKKEADQTSTPAFKKWFGKSKVVDTKGNPLRVYHGTNQSFERFDKERLGSMTKAHSATAFYFTSDSKEASLYADSAARKQVADIANHEKEVKRLQGAIAKAERSKSWNEYERLMEQWEALEIDAIRDDVSGANVIPAFLSMQNPLVVNVDGLIYTGEVQNHIDAARRDGHDGLILKNIEDSPILAAIRSDHYVVFEPTQIKSAIGNSGAFDPRNADILARRLGSGTQVGKLTSRDVRNEVNRILREFKTQPRLLVVDNASQFPKDLREAMVARGQDPNGVTAVQWNGGIYLNASKYTDLADVLDTMLHETVVHFGLRSVLDLETHEAILDGIAKSQPMAVRRMGQLEFGKKFDWNNLHMRRIAAEEVLAYYAPIYLKGKPVPTPLRQWLKKVMDAIRAFLQRIVGAKPETLVLPEDFDRVAMNRIIDALQGYLKSGQGPAYVETAEQAAMAQKPAPVFYSALSRAIENSQQVKASANQWMATIRNTGGVKPEEVEWSGVNEWLESIGRPVTREELVDYLHANQIEVNDVVKSNEAGVGYYDKLTNERDDLVVQLSALGFSAGLPNTGVLSNRDGDRWFLEDDGRWIPEQHGEYVTEETMKEYMAQNPMPKEVQEKGRRLNEIVEELRKLDDAEHFGEDTGIPGDVKYAQYTTPGGENYRELLLTLPETKTTKPYERWLQENFTGRDTADARRLYEIQQEPGKNYRSSHWVEPNILAHVRFDERTDADGKRVLFIEEIQSDWHQAGRKRGYQDKNVPSIDAFDREARAALKRNDNLGYDNTSSALQDVRHHPTDWRERWDVPDENDAAAIERYIDAYQAGMERAKGVPDAPFKTTWPELAFKRMIRWAAENGFDRIAWTPGKEQAERYSLRKHISKLEWKELDDQGNGTLLGWNHAGNNVVDRTFTTKELPDVIGQEVADRLLGVAPLYTTPRGRNVRVLAGLDLEVGGEGMIGFYDKILPATVNKMVKRWGTRVGTTTLMQELTVPEARRLGIEVTNKKVMEAPLEVHSVDVTPEMRGAALQGLPMFQRTSDVLTREIPKGSDEARGYAKVANAIINTWNKKIGNKYGALGNLPETKAYLVERYKALGGLTQVREITRGIFESLSKASPEDSERVYAYLTTAGADPAAIEDEKVRATAINVKEMIDAQGQALVDAGLLSEESYEAYRDQYLPRLYLRHILEDNGKGRAMGAGKRLSDMGYLKQRKDIPEEVRKVILGEITDPAFLGAFGVSRTMRDLTIMNFLQTIAGNKAWVPEKMMLDWDGRQVSPYWLQSEAKQLRRQADHIKNAVIAGKARAIADRMDTLANTALEQMGGEDLSDFKQIPDSARYGSLRGMYVRKEIHEDLVGAHQFVEADSLLETIFGQGGTLSKVTRAWKTSKVALNVPSHFRNMMGNAMMLHLSGVQAWRVPDRLISAIHSIVTKDAYYEIAKKYGLKEATFANTELYRIRDEWLLLQKSKQPTVNKLHALFGVVTDKVGDVYQFEEALFKVAKLIDSMAEGKSEADAMIEAHKWVFDYSLVPRWVRYTRNAPFGIPFLSYSYFALPRLAETAIRKPWKFLPYYMVGVAIQQALVSAFGGSDDDWKKLKAAFPEWMKEKGGMMLLPYKDSEGRWQVVDMGYTVPWGQLADMMAQVQAGKVRATAETMGILSGPIPDVIAAWQTGLDPFTGKPIAAPGDPAWQQAQSYLGYAYGMAAPGFLTGQGAFGKIKDAMTGRVDPRSGEPGLTKTQAWMRLFGVSVYPVDPEVTRSRNLRFMQFEIDEARKRMGEQLRDRNLDDAQKDAIRELHKAEIQRRQEAMRQYQQDSEIPDNLKRQRDDLTSRVAPLIDGKNKAQAVQALRDAGHPALAALFEDMRAKPRRVVSQSLAEVSHG